jgi:hypothetical protein
LELRVEHGRDQLVELALFEYTLADEFHQMQVAIRLGQFDIDAGFHRQPAGFLQIWRDGVAAHILAGFQLVMA